MHTSSLPPTDRDEAHETNGTKKAEVSKSHNPDIRAKLSALRASGPEWSNGNIAKAMRSNSSYVSQYLDPSGCRMPGDIPLFEKQAANLLHNLSVQRLSGVETIANEFADKMLDVFELIRDTKTIGSLVAESGEGKSRGIQIILQKNVLASHFQANQWHRRENALVAHFFATAGRGKWDHKTNWMDFAAKELAGSNIPFVIDDAHKLTLQSLQLCVDFHEATKCPLLFVGTFKLHDVLARDPQVHSRVIINEEVTCGDSKATIRHLINSLIPEIGADYEPLAALCEQVAKNSGHFRGVHMRLRLAKELRGATTKIKSWDMAFRAAHTKTGSAYQLV